MCGQMKQRFRIWRREKHARGGSGVYYLEDTETGKRTSLQTTDRQTAERLLNARREAEQQPQINLQIARTYLLASDPTMVTRTWKGVIQEIIETKTGETQKRWEVAARDTAFDLIRDKPLVQTRAEHFLAVLKAGTVSTNVYLRRLHNFAIDMNWLLSPVLVKRKWPVPVYRKKRAITLDEHRSIVARETNPERRAFYELAWHLGASQSDLASLHADDVDWQKKIITYERMKLHGRGKIPPQITLGPELETLLRRLPQQDYLFPYLRTVRAGDRATEFKQRCRGLGIEGVTLHSYRYSWAQRAKKAGYPERWAQVHLGHNSRAMAEHYSRGAELVLPSLENWTVEAGKILTVEFKPAEAVAGNTVPATAQSEI